MDEGMYYLKTYVAQGYRIVAICDEEIIGKIFREGNTVLEVSPNFYMGERVDFEKVLEAIENADIAVITGRRVIEKLSQLGVIDKNFALKVEDQLHIQILKEAYG